MYNSKDFNLIEKPFEPTAESLSSYECPEWFRDAKFGIWSHWGPQSVPMFGDWYARNMYMEGSDQYRYHTRKYGHPSQFGYKDIVKLWKAENFDPAELMDLYVEAGAKYFVGQAMHHDNFDNFDSKYNEWNSTKIGPMKNISQLWKEEAKRYNLPFGLTEHLAASFTWLSVSKGSDKKGPYAGVPYDGADSAYESLYRDNDSEFLSHRWYTVNERYHIQWLKRITDIIDQFQPELLYSDGGLPFDEYGLAMIAHLYNTSVKVNGFNNAVYNYKSHYKKHGEGSEFKVGTLDIERGITDKPLPEPWQDDTSMGDWFYNVKDVYKTAEDVADTLVDIVSKNGNLLMNVTQKPDGTIDEESRYALKKIGVWLKANGAGIYATRPYKVATEGNTSLSSGAFKEGKATWTSEDFRFSASKDGSVVYAFQMRAADNKAVIRNLGKLYEKDIKNVTIGDVKVNFTQKDGALYVEVPSSVVIPGMPVCIKAEL
jgi:alpha-L-fucosidase